MRTPGDAAGPWKTAGILALLLGAGAGIAHLLFDAPSPFAIAVIAALLAPLLLIWTTRLPSVPAASRPPGPHVRTGDVLNYCGAKRIRIRHSPTPRSESVAVVRPQYLRGLATEPDAHAAADGGGESGFIKVHDRATGTTGWVLRDHLDWMPSL